jgi:hypothetical protein
LFPSRKLFIHSQVVFSMLSEPQNSRHRTRCKPAADPGSGRNAECSSSFTHLFFWSFTMTKFTATIASAAALLLAGNVFAQAPAAGEGPLFLDEVLTVASSNVRAPVSIQQVASGEQSGVVAVASDSAVSRAEVRQATLKAFANGERPSIGERS